MTTAPARLVSRNEGRPGAASASCRLAEPALVDLVEQLQEHQHQLNYLQRVPTTTVPVSGVLVVHRTPVPSCHQIQTRRLVAQLPPGATWTWCRCDQRDDILWHENAVENGKWGFTAFLFAK